MQRDFYQVLGVARDASPAEVRGAFIRLARRHHPDGTGQTADLPGRLQDVQQAYRCLSDADARARHDRALDDDERRHLARQRAARRRLRRYDRRHPSAAHHARRRIGWRLLLMMGAAVPIVAFASLRLAG